MVDEPDPQVQDVLSLLGQSTVARLQGRGLTVSAARSMMEERRPSPNRNRSGKSRSSRSKARTNRFRFDCTNPTVMAIPDHWWCTTTAAGSCWATWTAWTPSVGDS
ncbi:hypothetical protein [Haladaptatus sp. R4]|uniref:hypothetical protein n=1 Tax=Haladaptatus sp. R4 TaxID=1679489 RepID=UPI001CBBCB29|nr:hypothetical protein [Haladaptatus sp. R4]